MRPATLATLGFVGLATMACLGPYPNLGEKLDVTGKVAGTSYIALDAGAARILVLAPRDGGQASPFTRIDESQPRAVETLQGDWSDDATQITISTLVVFTMPNEASLPVSQRRGATRQELSPPRVSSATIDAADGGTLDLSGSPELDGHYRSFLDRTAVIEGTDATSTACAFYLANLAVESSEARIPGFNSAGLTQYLNREEPFAGILSGSVTISLANLFSPVTTNTFRNYADFEGVTLDGVQISTTDSSGNGSLSGVLEFRIDRRDLPPIDGRVDYGEVSLSGGNEGGNYLVTLDGGTTVQVPTGRRNPSLEQCLGF